MKGIIFDFNGTMFQDSHLHEEAWVYMVNKYSNGSLREEDILELYNQYENISGHFRIKDTN